MSSPDLTLYTVRTPNGIKVSIALEELGLKYKVHAIDFKTNEQKEPWFLAINPNGRIPALTDASFADGAPLHVFESGSILEYLVDRYDADHRLSYPRGSREAYQVANWLHWQMGGLGPMQGQANHFFRYAPEKIQYGIDRYQNETRRLYSVLETALQASKSGFLVGDHLSIADIACWGWVKAGPWAGVQLEEFPALKAWKERLAERPAFAAGADVPPATEEEKRPKTKEEEERIAQEAREWIMKGMKADAEKKAAADGQKL